MGLLTEGTNLGDLLKFEGEDLTSRKQAHLQSGSLGLGAVVGLKNDSASGSAGTNTGGGTAGAVTLGRLAIPGTYVLTCKEKVAGAGVFSVVTPKGAALPDLTVGVAYTGDHINLTISDGSPDFEVADSFTVAVAGSSEIVEYNPSGSLGAQFAAGVLLQPLNATSAPQVGVIVARNAVVSAKYLAWKSGMTAPQKAVAMAQLETLGILVREAA